MSNAATFDSKKPTTKQELIAANIKLLIEQLEEGHSDALTHYLTAMSRFHNYSFGNVLEIARQMPTATRVAGFWTWKNLGRSVNSGAKGIRILAPIVGFKRKKDEEAEKDITKQNTRSLLGFRNAYVFDISQTNGVELPTIDRATGNPGEGIERLSAFVKSQGIQLVYNAKIAPALGMSYGGRIAILPGQTKAEEFSTLVHETAHEMLHKAERRTATTKTVRETEAEAVAFVVGKAVGLGTGNASADYIQLYHGNASLLAESLEVIQQTASVILAALEPPVEDEAAQPSDEPEQTAELAEAAGCRPSSTSSRRPAVGTTAYTSKSTTRPLWSLSSRRPTSQARAAYRLSLSATTESRTATLCATRRCALSWALPEAHT